MANCVYCGKPAGFLRNKHAECEQIYLQQEQATEKGKESILTEASQTIKGTDGFSGLEKTILEIEKTSLVPNAERNALLIKAWESSVDQFLEDGILDESEENRLIEFKNHFNLSQNDLDKNGAFTKTAKRSCRYLVTNLWRPCHKLTRLRDS